MIPTGTMDVAKSKPGKKRDIDDYPRKPIIMQLRGSLEYKTFLEELAEFEGLSVAAMLDRAAREFAKNKGFTKPIPKR